MTAYGWKQALNPQGVCSNLYQTTYPFYFVTRVWSYLAGLATYITGQYDEADFKGGKNKMVALSYSSTLEGKKFALRCSNFILLIFVVVVVVLLFYVHG